ncbi:uncharacterized protein LOC106096290 isoform X2 [Stomoxys calcitrans]|uniref:uncharacterized protein LOC106096290 isoform X2 n=1 Tax=Stomoxys calcitrans TaxID=35570 RepID=UPI0027E28478|nr:uncharacterized protein LOC106096290 isoform X2 [Stomoxys calcitrans]
MCASEDKAFSFKFETEDNSNFSSYQQDEEQSDINQVGELIPIKTAEGGHTSVYLRTGNRLLFCSGKYFYIEHTIAQTDHQKEHTGIVCTCHTCGVKIKGSLKVSSNFICHLKNKHPEVYQEFLRQKADFSAPYVRSWKKINSHRVNPYLPTTPLLNNFIQNNEKQEQFQQSVLRFLLATNQTFDVVENPSFLKLFEFSEVPRQMHAAEYYEKLVAEACEYKKLELCQTFNDGSVFVCNTIDTWTYNSSKFLAISSHWIDEHFQRQSAFVACRRLSMEEDCEEVQNKVFAHFGFVSTTITACPTHNIHNMTEDFIIFGLSKEVLAERGKNLQEEMIYQLNFLPISNKNAMQLEILKLHKIWVRNFVSKLNNDMKLVHRTVIEKCCHIWSSWHCKDFKEFFNSLFGEPLSKPQIFSSTSIYTAIKQLVANKNKLEQLCRLINKPCFSLEEIGYLEELLDVFEPLNAVFVFLDLPQNHYYGCFLPSLVTLKWKLTRLYNSKKLFRLQDTLKLLKEEILHEFKDYYDLSESKSEAVIAALTYPPVKTRFLMGLKDNINCLSFQPRTVLLKYGKDYHQHHEDQPNSNNKMSVCQGQMSMEHSANGSDFFDFGDTTETVDDEANLPHTLRLEIDTYLADAGSTLISLQKYPTIRRMFYRFNTCIPSPTSVYRIFPVHDILQSSLRFDSNEHFENSLFYKYYH